jgi:hypothetical protein
VDLETFVDQSSPVDARYGYHCHLLSITIMSFTQELSNLERSVREHFLACCTVAKQKSPNQSRSTIYLEANINMRIEGKDLVAIHFVVITFQTPDF